MSAFPEVMEVPVLSTTHITRADSDLIGNLVHEDPDKLPFVVVPWLDYGWVFHIPEDDFEETLREWSALGVSDSFIKVLQLAQGQGFAFVRLDSAGPKCLIEGLDLHEW